MQKNIWNKNALISPNIRVRYPERFTVGNSSIIDDFCYFSVDLCIGQYFHIASNCTIAGGYTECFTAGHFGGLASGCKLFCASDDFINDIGNVLPSKCGDIKNHTLRGGIYLCDYVTIGANSVLMPDVYIPKGTCIGAMSFVPSGFEFEPWSIYVMKNGKLTKVKDRNKANVLRQAQEVKRRMSND